MRGRRGEVHFVAVRVGRSTDPKEVLGLARRLKVTRAAALGFVVLWEEFILEVGDALTGRVQGYAAEHVAAKCGWEGSPQAFVKALKEAGLLRTQRRVFLHPYWLQSITGQYARERAELREAWRRKKREQRQTVDVPIMSPGQVGDVHRMSSGKTDIEREINGNGAAPPRSPPSGGDSISAARWAWLLEHAPNPQNRDASCKYLALLSDDEWALVQEAYGRLEHGRGPLSSGKRRALNWPTHRFLSHQAYLQFRRKTPSKGRQPNGQPTEPIKVENAGALSTQPLAFLLAQLADPDLSDAKKEQLRKRWQAEHPGESPPWKAD